MNGKHRYYSILRPVSIGTFPNRGKIFIRNFIDREFVESIGREAWGYVEYDPGTVLTQEECDQYDLVEGK